MVIKGTILTFQSMKNMIINGLDISIQNWLMKLEEKQQKVDDDKLLPYIPLGPYSRTIRDVQRRRITVNPSLVRPPVR